MPSGTSFASRLPSVHLPTEPARKNRIGVLEVAFAGPLRHRGQRSHAAIGLERPALVQNRFAGAFFRPSQQRADHHAVRARGDRLGDVAGVLDAAVGDDRDIAVARGTAASAIAVICGTPAPVTTRVVQIDPGPMPTLMPSAPRTNRRHHRRLRCCPPANRTSGSAALTFTASITRVECPCALSMASTSTFIFTSSCARSR